MQDVYPGSNDVSQFLVEWEAEDSEMCYQLTAATWSYITNITEYNKNKMVRLKKMIFFSSLYDTTLLETLGLLLNWLLDGAVRTQLEI